jgi:hypothetical protein
MPATGAMYSFHRRFVAGGDARIRRHHEDDRRRVGNPMHHQLRLGRERGMAGGVEDREPAREERMREVDDGIAPARDLDAFGEVRREAQVRRILRRHDDRLGEHVKGGGQRLELRGLERDLAPSVVAGDELAQRLGIRARLDRQQPDRGRARRIPEDLGGTERRASHARRQQPHAHVGEEERIDELALAARELGDEGDREPFGREAPLDVREARRRVLVDEARHDGPAAKCGELLREGLAPLAQLLEARLEGARRNDPGAGGAHRWQRGQ